MSLLHIVYVFMHRSSFCPINCKYIGIRNIVHLFEMLETLFFSYSILYIRTLHKIIFWLFSCASHKFKCWSIHSLEPRITFIWYLNWQQNMYFNSITFWDPEDTPDSCCVRWEVLHSQDSEGWATGYFFTLVGDGPWVCLLLCGWCCLCDGKYIFDQLGDSSFYFWTEMTNR